MKLSDVKNKKYKASKSKEELTYNDLLEITGEVDFLKNFSRTELEGRKTSLESDIAEIDDILAEF